MNGTKSINQSIKWLYHNIFLHIYSVSVLYTGNTKVDQTQTYSMIKNIDNVYNLKYAQYIFEVKFIYCNLCAILYYANQ